MEWDMVDRFSDIWTHPFADTNYTIFLQLWEQGGYFLLEKGCQNTVGRVSDSLAVYGLVIGGTVNTKAIATIVVDSDWLPAVRAYAIIRVVILAMFLHL